MAKKRRARVRKSSTKNWGQKGVSQAVPATILIPSGKCPFVVESTDEEDIKQWIIEVTNEKAGVVTYDKSVYRYWLRHSFDIHSQDYKDAKNIVEEILPERIKSIDDLGF
jgi:hypothetical protein